MRNPFQIAGDRLEGMEFEFTAQIWEWRGPAPHHFVSVPADDSAVISEIAPDISYGWGAIPATVTVRSTTWTTAIFPKDGTYIVPVKLAVRNAESLAIGDSITVTLRLTV